jgi:hypothetical protein
VSTAGIADSERARDVAFALVLTMIVGTAVAEKNVS